MKIAAESVTPEKIRDELSGLLRVLPSWRRKKALSFAFDRDQYLCAKSFLLLQKMIQEEYDLPEIPPFSYGTNGKPCWREFPHIHFNISHCENGIACAVNEEPVGIDIERIFFDQILAKAVLSPTELEVVLNAASPAQQFSTYWTQKESFLKLTGTGIGNDLQNLLHQHGNELRFETYPHLVQGCIVTTAVWKDDPAPGHG